MCVPGSGTMRAVCPSRLVPSRPVCQVKRNVSDSTFTLLHSLPSPPPPSLSLSLSLPLGPQHDVVHDDISIATGRNAMAVDMEELILRPFQDLRARGQEALANGEAAAAQDEVKSRQLVKAAKALVREGDRALFRLEPLWQNQEEMHGEAFRTKMSKNGTLVHCTGRPSAVQGTDPRAQKSSRRSEDSLRPSSTTSTTTPPSTPSSRRGTSSC